MKTGHYQAGLSTSALILIIGIAGFFLTLFFKIGPAYLDNHGVRSALKSMATNSADIDTLEKEKIYKQLGRFFAINNVRDHSPKDLKIVRLKNKTLINHEYEKRIPIFPDIDVVVSFRNQLDSTNVDACCEFLVEEKRKKKD